MSELARRSDRVDETLGLRACVRDLVAIASMPACWIGRTPHGIAEGLRDVLVTILHADAVSVELRDGSDGTSMVMETELDHGRDDDQEAGLRFAGVPIGIDGEVGRFVVSSRRPEFPSELEQLLMQVAANETATALAHVALLARQRSAEQQLQARASQQAVVARLGMRALIGISSEQMLAETVIAVRDTLHADFAELLQLVDDGAALLLRSVAGWPQELVGRTRQRIGPGSHASYALQVRAPVVVHDLRAETRFTPPPLLCEHGVRSGISVIPLLCEHGVRSGISVIVHAPAAPFGVLGVHTREPRAFSDDDVYFMQSVANLLAAALERHRAEAEREELLARTAAAQAEAERASRVKSEFLGMMSHELKTPLSAIGGYASLMSEGISGPVTDAQRSDLARIRRSQEYLVGLIDNVLGYLRLGSGRITYEIAELRVEELLDTAEELVRLQIEAKGLCYERQRAGADVRVRADAAKMQQVLLNLLSNAAKFTDQGGRVRLGCTPAGATVAFRVEDTGRGIPADKLESVFEPFVRIEGAPSQRVEGTGLGLAISRELARGMAGDLRVESEVGKGSTFTLVLPRGG